MQNVTVFISINLAIDQNAMGQLNFIGCPISGPPKKGYYFISCCELRDTETDVRKQGERREVNARFLFSFSLQY